MGLNFEFATSTQIIFGCGSLKTVPEILKQKGRRILLITGSDSRRAAAFTELLPLQHFTVSEFRVEKEPSTDVISEGVEFARTNGCDAVVRFGGGSVIDSAKAIAALIPNSGGLLEYLEVIGQGRVLENPPVPFIAIPTTAGTGAEVTKNAVIHSPEHQVKVSLRSPLMFPAVAVVDPELTVSMPPPITATTGMDALTHLLETFVSNQSNPFIDMLCREGMKRISRSLRSAFDDGSSLEAREDMAFASMLGGMALANVKLGAVHGFAGPLGGMFPVPHGAVCAALLPAVMQVNYRVVLERSLDHPVNRFHEVGQLLTGNPGAGATEGIEWVQNMVSYLGIPKLTGFGLEPERYPLLVEKAKVASSMKGNPVLLNDQQLMQILLNS
jgi:alcohol dehydrogenase class IV